MYTHRLCAWRARSSAAARPPPFNRRCAALSSSSVASWIHCCKNVTPAARALASRFALRLCAAARRRCSRCCARSPCSPLRGSRPSIVQRCCAALLARFAGGRSCAAVAAPSPRCAGRGRRCGAVAPLVPASRVVARSRRCCGSPSGSVPYVNVRTRVSLSVPGVHVSTRPSTSVSTSRRGPYPSNITIFFTPPTPLKRGWVPIEHPLNQDLDIGGR